MYAILERRLHNLVTRRCVVRRRQFRGGGGMPDIIPHFTTANRHISSSSKLYKSQSYSEQTFCEQCKDFGNRVITLQKSERDVLCSSSSLSSSQNHRFLSTTTNQRDHGSVESRGASSTKNKQNRKQQYNKLVRHSKSLLNNLHKMSITNQTKEIFHLIFAWNKLWGPTSLRSTSMHRNKKRNSSSFLTIESVDFVDKLMNELFDITETMITTNQNINTAIQQPALVAILAWERVHPTQNTGVRVQKLLDRMMLIQDMAKEKHIRSPVKVNTVIFGAVISTWSNSIDFMDGDKIVNGGHMAEEVLNRMKTYHSENPDGDVKANLISHNTCLHGYAQRGMISEAELFLERLESTFESDPDVEGDENSLSPDVYSYSIMMNAYEKYRGKIKGLPIEKRAEKLLSKMMEKYERTGKRRFMPNKYTFGSVLSILAKSRSPEGAADADRVLHCFIDSYQKDIQLQINENELEEYPILQPKVDHFITVFLGYGRRRDKKRACDRIGELLVEMEQLHETGLSQVRPTYQCFVIYLDNLVKSNEENIEEKVNVILSRMEEMYLNSKNSEFVINNYGYNQLMDSIVKSREGGRAERVEAVMARMNDLYEKTLNETLLPDHISYTCLIKAYTTDGLPGYAEKCKTILKYMEDESMKGRTHLKPDKFVYAAVIHAVSREGYPEDGEKLIEEMETLGEKDPALLPNIQCYNILMSSYRMRRRKDAASNALRILDKVRTSQMTGNTNLRPSNVSFGICIDALARSMDHDKVQKAEELMTDLLELHKSTNDHNLAPTTSVWCSLLLVYAESKLQNKAEKALQIIDRMHKEGVTCDMVTFNTLLKACAKTNNFDEPTRLQVLDISKYAFSEIQNRNDLKPDTLTYSSLLWISDKFIIDEEEKRATIKDLFKSCCSEGQVSDGIISALMKIASKDVIKDLLGEELVRKRRVNIGDLPREWSQQRHRFRYRPRD